MNLRRVAEWCGYRVEIDGDNVMIFVSADHFDLFDPLNDNSDAFTVLAKLWTIGTFHKLSTRKLLWCKREKGLVGVYAESNAIVTDEASLRKAICEIAEKVSQQ